MHDSPIPLPRWVLPATLLVIVLGFLARNLPWHLDDYDQAKQAFVSFEMVQEGHWWLQHTPSGRVATKPPLAGWISAGLAAVTGFQSWDFAWRFPPFAAALLILWVLVREGRRLAGDVGAVIAAGAFGLNVITPRLATLVRTDMLLCLCIFLTGYVIYRKLRDGTAWTGADRLQVCALLAASVFVKGPIAYAFLLPGLLALWWFGRHQGWGRRAWSGWWPWLVPLALFAVWVALGLTLSKDFYEEVVVKEFLGRFTVGETARHRNQPIYFYFALLYRFFPWSILLAALLAVPDVRSKLRHNPAVCWLICWAAGAFIFMSLVPSKRGDRIFPVIPSLCLLIAALLPLLPRNACRTFLTKRSLFSLLAAAALISSTYAGAKVVSGFRQHERALVSFGEDVLRRAPGSRLAAVHGKDEGMLLYLGLTRFTKLDDAAAQWRAGQLDAIVLPANLWIEEKPDLDGARVELESVPSPAKNSRYLLVKRQK